MLYISYSHIYYIHFRYTIYILYTHIYIHYIYLVYAIYILYITHLANIVWLTTELHRQREERTTHTERTEIPSPVWKAPSCLSLCFPAPVFPRLSVCLSLTPDTFQSLLYLRRRRQRARTRTTQKSQRRNTQVLYIGAKGIFFLTRIAFLKSSLAETRLRNHNNNNGNKNNSKTQFISETKSQMLC